MERLFKLLCVYLVAYPCYWLGDLTWKVMDYPASKWDWEFHVDAMYSIYNQMMTWSADIDEWSGKETLWKSVSWEDIT